MVKEAEQHAGEDKKRRELVENRNQLEALIHSTENSITEAGDKLEDSAKSEVEAAIAEAKEKLESENPEELQAATQTLAQAAMKIGEAIYGGQAPEGAAEAGAEAGEGPAEDDNVVDADFEEVKDDDKKSA
mgnify:CR=1 FL=1